MAFLFLTVLEPITFNACTFIVDYFREQHGKTKEHPPVSMTTAFLFLTVLELRFFSSEWESHGHVPCCSICTACLCFVGKVKCFSISSVQEPCAAQQLILHCMPVSGK